MMLLAIDTCGSLGGVALEEIGSPTSQERDVGYQDAGQRVWFRELAGRTFSERLLATVAELLAEAGVSLGQIDGIVVVHGPGSFTGIRIGVSAAKGLAEALGVPVIAVSRLELLARKAADADAVAVLDAGRGEFFVGVYREGICEFETLLNREELISAVAEAGLPMLVCEERVFAGLEGDGAEMVVAPTAAEALAAGMTRFLAGDFDDVVTLDANYLRRSETEMLARIAGHKALRAEKLATAVGDASLL